MARSPALALCLCLWPAVVAAQPQATPANETRQATPPVVVLRPPAAWPGEPGPQDVNVPVVLTIGADGAVERVEIAESAGRELDAAAVRAARAWVFEPARRGGEPVGARVRASVRFEGQPALAPPAPQPVAPASAPPPPPLDDTIEVLVVGDVPARSASQTTRRRDVLSAAPHRTASDLLKTLPGVFITQHSGEGKAHQIFFRGFDAVHGQDLEIDVGGIVINELSNVHGQGYADLHFVMPEVIQRIEALPGAFDPSQGDFAVAGSLRLHLGYEEEGITAKGSYGRFDTQRLFLAYRPPGQPEQTFAAFEAYSTGGFGVGRASNRTSGVAQALVPITEHFSARLLASTYAGRFGSAGVLVQRDVEAGLVDRFASYDTAQGGHSTRSQVLTELRYDDETWRASLAPYLVRRTLRLRFNFTGLLGDPDRGDNTTQKNDSTSFGLTARLERHLPLFSGRDTLAAGVSARHDLIDQSHEPTHGQGPPLVGADVTATDVGGYLDASLHPLDRLTVRGGVRVDGLSFGIDDRLTGTSRSSQGLVATPKITVDVLAAPGLHLLASYGQGFRSPQARSLADGEQTPFTRMNGFELGARYTLGSLTASAAGFATLLDDDLVFNESTSRNEAVPGTLRLGAAADLALRHEDWLTSAFSLSYTRATLRGSNERLAEGDLLPFVPQLVMRNDVAIRPLLTRLWDRELRALVGVGLDYLYNRPLPFGEVGNDVFLADAQVGLRLKEVELVVQATNLLDADWYDGQFVYASSFDPAAIASQIPRRHVTVGAPFSILGTLALYL